MAGWVSLFGFTVTSVRALNYVTIIFVAIGFVFLFRRLGKPSNILADVFLLLVFLGGAGVSYNYREARPDTLGMLVALLIALAAISPPPRHRLMFLTAAAVFAPFTGLQTVAYVALVCATWLVMARRNYAEIVAVAVGVGLGLLALATLYAMTGTLRLFVEHLPENAKDGAGPLRDVYLSDRSLIPALLATACLRFATRHRVVAERLDLVRFLVLISITTPISLAIIGKFPITYAWMAYSPAVLAAMLLMSEISWRDLDRLGKTATVASVLCLLFAAATFPARLLVVALEWQARSYRAVENFIDQSVTSSDVAYSGFPAYYPVRAKARVAYFEKHIQLMDPAEKAAVTVLVLDRKDVANTIALMGGNWTRTGSFMPVLDSVPRHFGLGERGYDLVVMRRIESGRRE